MALVAKPGGLTNFKWFRRIDPADNQFSHEDLGSANEIAYTADPTHYEVITNFDDTWRSVPFVPTTIPQ